MSRYLLPRFPRESKIEFRKSQSVHMFVDGEIISTSQIPETEQKLDFNEIDDFTRYLLINGGINVKKEKLDRIKRHAIRGASLATLFGTLATSAAVYETVVSDSNLIKAGCALGAIVSTIYTLDWGLGQIDHALNGTNSYMMTQSEIIQQLQELAPENNLDTSQT